MAKILIPTRNRPTSLSYVLGFISKFYPGQEIIIADGSYEEYKPVYRKLIKSDGYKNINIDYREFNSDITLADRLVHVLNTLSDELIIMGADDDYPFFDTLSLGEKFLLENNDYSTAMGSTVNLYLYDDGTMSARLGVSRPINSNSIVKRVLDFSEWAFSTTYAVTRRNLLIERYQRASKFFLANFSDYTTGILDCMTGKIKALRDITFTSTRSYSHSYLRPGDDLIYLRRGNEVLKYIEIFQNDLLNHSSISESKAHSVAKKLIQDRIAQMAGGRVHRKPGFSKSPLFKNRHIQYQYHHFHGLFTKNHPERKRLNEKLQYIAHALITTQNTSDNKGEKKKYETLEEQT